MDAVIMSDERAAVHVSHCCYRHGCKYGYGPTRDRMLVEGGLDAQGSCPVATGSVEQEEPNVCEQCYEEDQVRTRALKAIAADPSTSDVSAYDARRIVDALIQRDILTS